MKKVSIYVVSHKENKRKYPPCYHVLHVGKNDFHAEFYDDKGDNISDKNDSYCELTALYWIWKNADDGIVGLEHYRRIFSTTLLSNNKHFFLSEKKINTLLENNQCIVTKLYNFKKTIFENRTEFCYEKDLLLLEETIKEVVPEYYDTYKQVFDGHCSFLCNMIIADKNLIDSYAEWLFKILFSLEKIVDISSYEGNYKRIYGYLGEVLLTVYIFHNRIKFKECPVANLDVSLLDKAVRFLKTGRKK